MFQQRLFACPSDPNPFDLSCPGAINIDGPHAISYLINAYFVWGLNESQVEQPEDTGMYAERRSTTVGGASPYCDDIYHPWFNVANPNIGNANGITDEMDGSQGAMAATRHNMCQNFTFADCHAKYKVLSQMFSIAGNVDWFRPEPSSERDF